MLFVSSTRSNVITAQVICDLIAYYSHSSLIISISCQCPSFTCRCRLSNRLPLLQVYPFCSSLFSIGSRTFHVRFSLAREQYSYWSGKLPSHRARPVPQHWWYFNTIEQIFKAEFEDCTTRKIESLHACSIQEKIIESTYLEFSIG